MPVTIMTYRYTDTQNFARMGGRRGGKNSGTGISGSGKVRCPEAACSATLQCLLLHQAELNWQQQLLQTATPSEQPSSAFYAKAGELQLRHCRQLLLVALRDGRVDSGKRGGESHQTAQHSGRPPLATGAHPCDSTARFTPCARPSTRPPAYWV